MLSAFFWGYICTQLLGGWLSDWFGPKHVVGWGMAVANLAHLLTPVAARTNVYLIIALRAITGMGHVRSCFPRTIDSLDFRIANTQLEICDQILETFKFIFCDIDYWYCAKLCGVDLFHRIFTDDLNIKSRLLKL